MNRNDFLTVKEAIDLINTDTRTNPTVDDKRLVRGIEFLKANQRGGEMNYTIHLLKKDENGKIVPNGVKYAKVMSPREANELQYAIEDHYKSLSGKVVDSENMGLHKLSTTLDEEHHFQEKPRVNPNSTLKPGDELATGEGTQMVGDK